MRRKTKEAPPYPLDDHWVDEGDRPFVPTADYPMPLRHRERQDLRTLVPSETALWLTTFGWPLTADKSRRLSDTEVEEMAERYRSKLSSIDVTNLLTTRVAVARAYANVNAKKPLATQSRLIKEAENEAVSAMTGAYLKQAREHLTRSMKGGNNSVKKRQDKAGIWQTQALVEWGKMMKENPTRTARLTNGALAERIRFRLINGINVIENGVVTWITKPKTWPEDKPPGEVALRLFIGKERRRKRQKAGNTERQSN